MDNFDYDNQNNDIENYDKEYSESNNSEPAAEPIVASAVMNQQALPVKSNFMTNPVINKIRHTSPISDTIEDENAATYGGILVKFLIFFAFIVAGMVISSIIKSSLFTSSMDSTDFSTTLLIINSVAFMVLIVSSIVSSVAPKTTAVSGSVSCLALGFMSTGFIGMYETVGDIMAVALIITLVLVLSLALVYATGKMRVTSRFIRCASAIGLTYLISGLLFLIAYFIPALSSVTLLFMNDPLIVILCSLAGVVIGCMFLVSDFEMAKVMVDSKLPKQSEWAVSFSILFSIIWLYLKILSIAIRLSGKRKK